jgi:hypothetical protein
MGGFESAPVRLGQAGRRTAALLFACALGISAAALAQSAAPGTAPTGSQTVRMISSGQAGGGGRSQGGLFSLQGTIGQTVAKPMSGGNYLMRNGFIPMCPSDCELGDIDCDGSVNGGDLGIMLLLFGPCPDPFSCVGDLDGNGEVDNGDVALLLVNWH